MKHLFIINPVAGKYDHTQEIIEQLEPFKQGREVEIAVTKAPRDAEDIVRKAAEAGEDLRVYACGGDGTFNEVAAGAAGLDNVAVTHYPLGSGNDFVKLFSDGGQSFHSLENLMGETDETMFDAIRCNDRIGANICSVGIDARIGTEINRYKRLPLVSGPMAYYISTIVNVIKGIHQHYVLNIDGEIIDKQLTLVCVGNGRCYGSTFKAIPEAEPDDGWLDVLFVDAVSRFKVAQVIGKYADGRHSEFPEIIHYRRCKRINIICDRENSVNVDGELIRAKNINMKIRPGVLKVFFPKGLTWNSGVKADAQPV